MFARITLTLLAAAFTMACASAEDAERWAADEAAISSSAEALECAVCQYEEYTPRQAEAPAEAEEAEEGDRARGDRPDGIEEQVCHNDLVWYEYCPTW